MKRISVLLTLGFFIINNVNSQSLSLEEIIKTVKTGQAKSLYTSALKKGMFGDGLKVDKEVDYATGDIDKELTVGIYRATKDDKNNFTWSIEIDSFVTSHRTQAIYTVPPAEAGKIKKYLAANKYTKTRSGDIEDWEKDGIILEFYTIVNDIYIYVKL